MIADPAGPSLDPGSANPLAFAAGEKSLTFAFANPFAFFVVDRAILIALPADFLALRISAPQGGGDPDPSAQPGPTSRPRLGAALLIWAILPFFDPGPAWARLGISRHKKDPQPVDLGICQKSRLVL